MVEKFCQLYGTPCPAEIKKFIPEHSGEQFNFCDFPSLKRASTHLHEMEKSLRDAGFGYRALYLKKTIATLLQHQNETGDGESWLHSLKSLPYSEAKEHLMSLPGVGPKVY
jgi:N-glycosylase/DNA lyase